MKAEDPKAVSSPKIIRIDEGAVQSHIDQLVRGSVEETLNSLLDVEADRLCNAARYERTEARKDTRAGSYERKLQTKSGEVTLKVPKLRNLPFETRNMSYLRTLHWSIKNYSAFFFRFALHQVGRDDVRRHRVRFIGVISSLSKPA